MDEVNLDKIAEFMNSEPEKEINSTEIENTLSYIDDQLSTVKEQTKEIKTEEDIAAQETTIDDLTKIALSEMGKVDKNTDEIYKLFYGPIAMKQDRSDASKVALLDSQRIKVEMINSLANLASAKAKLELAKSKLNTSGGVFVDARDGNQVGISIHSMWEGIKEEE